MITHGGSDGQLTLYGYPEDFVQEWTYEQLQTLDIGNGEKMPTLEEILSLFAESECLVNIELKGPLTESRKIGFDYLKSSKTVYELIRKYNYANRIVVSSFVDEIQQTMRVVMDKDMNPIKPLLFGLKNRENRPEPNGISGMQTPVGFDGVNVSCCFLTPEVVAQARLNASKIGCWLMAKDQPEDESVYAKVFPMQVDFFYSDAPLIAMAARDTYQTSLI